MKLKSGMILIDTTDREIIELKSPHPQDSECWYCKILCIGKDYECPENKGHIVIRVLHNYKLLTKIDQILLGIKL